MENRRGSEIFLGVVGVTTLLVAIIGATFAYFSATAKSANDAVTVKATTIALGYEDNVEGLNINMIPSEHRFAEYAAFNETHLASKEQCVDDNGNEICSVYDFYIGNPSKTTEMDVVATINVVTNEFTNLRYQILDETGTVVVPAGGNGEDGKPGVKFGATESSTEIEELNQTLKGNPAVEIENFDSEKPSTYGPLLEITETTPSASIKNNTNVRHYTMLIWLNEEGEGNVEESGKIFTAGISFSTGGESGGVTGIIYALQED